MTEQHIPPTGVQGRDDLYMSTHPNAIPRLDISPDPKFVAAIDELDDTIDEEWAIEHVPQIRAMQELVIDANNISQAASVLVRAMSEFAVDGEDFQPSVNAELREWLVEIVRAEVPDIDEATAEMVVDSVQDYPPINGERAQELARQSPAPAELHWA